MKVDVNKSLLVDMLGAIAPAAKGEPVQLAAKDGKLTAVAQNRELAISSGADASVVEEGSALVIHAALTQRVKTLPDGSVTLSIEGNQLQVKSGTSRFRIGTVIGVAPKVEIPQGDATVVDAPTLLSAVRQVAPSASSDVTRPALCGVYFDPVEGGDGLKLAATDTYRIAVRDLEGSGLTGSAALVPAAALVALDRAVGEEEKIAVRADESAVAFSGASTVVVARLIAAPFPPYGNLLRDDSSTTWKVSRQELLDSLRRAELVLKGTAAAVKITLADTGATINAVAPDGEDFEEEITSGTLAGDGLTFGVNPTFLRAGVEVMDGEEVSLGLNEALKPITVSGGDESLTYMVMPQRITR